VKALIVVGCLLVTSGCIKRLTGPALPAILNASVVYSPQTYAGDLARYNVAVFVNPSQAQAIRNSIVWSIMTGIDYAYGTYTSLLFAGKGTLGVVEDSTLLGMIAAGTIAANPATKTILGVLTGAVAGVNLSADQHFFAQQSFQSLAVAMQTRRAKALESITSSLNQDVTAYPLAAAQRDLMSYYFAGTLAGGLEELQEETTAAAQMHTARGLH
jgi:hypothetical protein